MKTLLFMTAGLLLASASLSAAASPPETTGLISVANYPSIQAALDQNPGKPVFVPSGDHLINEAIKITGVGSGLWGLGRIIQKNPDQAIVEVRNATRAQVRGITLTRAEGAQETRKAGLLLVSCSEAVVEGVQVIDNWTDSSPIRAEKCTRIVVRDCLVENYYRVTVEDWTKPSGAGVTSGFAYNCINGTGMNFVEVYGALIQGNRVVETRLLPTPEIMAKFQLGKFIKKNETKGGHIDQESWDKEYWAGWRQGAGIHVGTGRTSDSVQIIGNLVEHTQQGMDIHGDHVIVANNIVNDAGHGIKSMHGSRNILITGNQFNRCDLFAIGLMQGAASHEAGKLPGKGESAVVANIDGHTIISNNIISDFGYGSQAWIWKNQAISSSPIQLGGRSPYSDTPPLRNVVVSGNIIYNPGQDKILVEGVAQVVPPRYRYAVRIVEGDPDENLSGPPGGRGSFANTPRNLHFSENLFDPGIEGISNVDLDKLSR